MFFNDPEGGSQILRDWISMEDQKYFDFEFVFLRRIQLFPWGYVCQSQRRIEIYCSLRPQERIKVIVKYCSLRFKW